MTQIRRLLLRKAYAVIAAALLTPLTLMAQSGHPVLVVNVMTADGRPVADALVRLRTAGRLTRTDWIGEARLTRVPRGRQQVQVARIGYAPAVVDLVISGDTTGASFVLEQLTDTLAAVNVTARAPSMPAANLADFNRRKAMGIGRFLDDTVFERYAGRELTLMLSQRLPGLRAQAREDIPGKYKLISGRGQTRFMGGPCRVDVYMDGVPVSANDRSEQDAIDHLSPQDLAGAELYSMESAPAQFRTASKACHVLLLWTRW